MENVFESYLNSLFILDGDKKDIKNKEAELKVITDNYKKHQKECYKYAKEIINNVIAEHPSNWMELMSDETLKYYKEHENFQAVYRIKQFIENGVTNENIEWGKDKFGNYIRVLYKEYSDWEEFRTILYLYYIDIPFEEQINMKKKYRNKIAQDARNRDLEQYNALKKKLNL